MPRRLEGEVWTIVVAGGSGRRFGGPKQFEPLGSCRVVDHSLAAAAVVSAGVVLVAPPGTHAEGARHVVAVGDTRSASVRSGLAVVPAEAAVVVVHDAARPLATTNLFERTIAAVRDGADGAVPAVAITDSLRRRGGGPVDRDGLVAVQTPQAFRAEVLRSAHVSEPDATDDSALVEAAGGTIRLVPGERWNLKITDPEDLAVAAALLATRS